ncbi:hypothetical protein ACFOLG_16165 [Vogesella facilis]|uniref:Uncharacterized protein n=1 Tax=Vogesella facilis TaxID=1655232 RepID=A0ABV7RHM8_9NEIS
MNSKPKEKKHYRESCDCQKFWAVWHLAKKFSEEKGMGEVSPPRKVDYGWQLKLITGEIVTVYSRKGKVRLSGNPNGRFREELLALIPAWEVATFNR